MAFQGQRGAEVDRRYDGSPDREWVCTYRLNERCSENSVEIDDDAALIRVNYSILRQVAGHQARMDARDEADEIMVAGAGCSGRSAGRVRAGLRCSRERQSRGG